MMKFETDCYYCIVINAGKSVQRTEIVEIRSIEKERDGKKYIQIAKGRYYVSMNSDMLGLYPNDNDDWHSYIGQLDPSKDKKYMISYGERGVHRLMIKTLFEFEGDQIEIR